MELNDESFMYIHLFMYLFSKYVSSMYVSRLLWVKIVVILYF